MDMLVSTQWLASQPGAADLVVLDASGHLPDAGRDAAAEFAEGHLPGARFFDLKGLFDPASPVPAALPTRAQFAAHMARLGVSAGDRVVFYDNSAMRTAARAWFIARLYGLEQVAVLDGGQQKWAAEGRALETGTPEIAPAQFAAPRGGTGAVRYKADMLANLDSAAEQVVDARGAVRFAGYEPDFRPGVASGHIPNSRNVPFDAVLRPDGTFRDAAGIRAAFAAAGVDLEQPVTTTCGSGVTASVLLFALAMIGKHDTALYDGSWSEWGADPATPKATGTAA